MPLPLSSIAIREKNKQTNAESIFIICLEIFVPSLEEPIRVCSDVDHITWRGEMWVAFPFQLNEIRESAIGEIPRVELKVANPDYAVEDYIHQYDSYCKLNGFAPIICKIYIVNSLNLGSPIPEVEHTFQLIQPKSQGEWMSFTLGAANPFNIRIPQSRILPSCRWHFKSVQCGYVGSQQSCDKSFSQCRAFGNSGRFGGFLPVGRR